MSLARQQALLISFLLLTLIVVGCAKKEDIIVVSKEFQRERVDDTAVPLGLGMSSPGAGNQYYVVGKLRNVGLEEVTKVMVSFKCVQGKETKLLTAEIDRIAAGATVGFRTWVYKSVRDVKLLEQEPPEITYE